MSKTYRKYPTYRYLRDGIFYKDWENIPEPETALLVEEEVRKTFWIWEWEDRTCYDKYGKTILGASYKKRVLKKEVRSVKTGAMVPVRRWCWPQNYTTVSFYHEKSTEGWKHNNREWCSHGVGKENKQLRSRMHRSQAKHIIRGKWMKGDYDIDIPREHNHDRWDWW